MQKSEMKASWKISKSSVISPCSTNSGRRQVFVAARWSLQSPGCACTFPSSVIEVRERASARGCLLMQVVVWRRRTSVPNGVVLVSTRRRRELCLEPLSFSCSFNSNRLLFLSRLRVLTLL